MQASSVTSISPSFNSYSNTKLAEIAARVVEEFGSEEFYDEFYFERDENPDTTRTREEEESSEYVERERGNSVIEEEEDDEEREFEFAFVNRETEFSSPISADEIFYNGQIRPVYPVFNRRLFLECTEFQQENEKDKSTTVRLPLRKLFVKERETSMTTTSSCSSSEADELDGVPADSYCVWRPKEAAAEGRCKKSSSAGSNFRRWKFTDLLYRSHSDGSRDNFVFLSSANTLRKKQNEERRKDTPVSGGVKPPPPPVYSRDGGE